jgi:hypothetical protein
MDASGWFGVDVYIVLRCSQAASNSNDAWHDGTVRSDSGRNDWLRAAFDHSLFDCDCRGHDSGDVSDYRDGDFGFDEPADGDHANCSVEECRSRPRRFPRA